MKKEILINAKANETRIVIVEEERLVEVFLERPEKERMVGDIYKGRVAKVLPGMKAAFINVGMKQDAFLHFSDIGDNTHIYPALADTDDSDDTEMLPEKQKRRKIIHSHDSDGRFLRVGQEILVQIIKEPISTKGARVTSEISIPGRFTVLIPNNPNEMIGVSRKINHIQERKRLKRIAQEIKPGGFGLIIRTNAEDKEENVLRQDIEQCLQSWNELDRKAKTMRAPSLVYKDMEMVSSVIRDLFSNDVHRVLIDNRSLFRQILQYVQSSSPQLTKRIEYYHARKPLFDMYNIEQDIQACTEKKVLLKNGGYIIIEHTEALVSIDVNSGKYIGRASYEENALAVNLTAGREITRQLRLRDIGGLIVIDFIDLRDEKNRRRLFEDMKRELRKDRAKFSILPMDEYGLIELTRERVRPSILFAINEPCPACAGTGWIAKRSTFINKIERWIRRYKQDHRLFSRVRITMHPDMLELIGGKIRRFFWKYRVWIILVPEDEMRIDEFRAVNSKGGDITDSYLQ